MFELTVEQLEYASGACCDGKPGNCPDNGHAYGLDTPPGNGNSASDPTRTGWSD